MGSDPRFLLNTFGEQRQPGSVRVRAYRDLLDRIKEIKIVDTDVGSDEMEVTLDNHDGRAYANTEVVHGRVWGISLGYGDDMGPWRYFTVKVIRGFFTVQVIGYQLDTSMFHDRERTKEWTVASVLEAIGPSGHVPESLRSTAAEEGGTPAQVLRTEVVAGVVSARNLTLDFRRSPFDTTVNDTGFNVGDDGRFQPSFEGGVARNAGFDSDDESERDIAPSTGDRIRGHNFPVVLAGDVLGAGPSRDRIKVANAVFTNDDLFSVGTVAAASVLNNFGTYKVIQVISPTEIVTDKVFTTETATGGLNDFGIFQPGIVVNPNGGYTNADIGRRLTIGPTVINPSNLGTFMIANVPSPTSVQLVLIADATLPALLIVESDGFSVKVLGAGLDNATDQKFRDKNRDIRLKEQRKPKTENRRVQYQYNVEKSRGRFDKIMQTNETDAQFLTKLAKALGYVWYIESFGKRWFDGNVIPIVHFRSRDFKQDVTYTLDADRNSIIGEPSIDFNILEIPDRSFTIGTNPVLQALFQESQEIATLRRIMNDNATPLREIERLYPTTATDDKKAQEEADGMYKRAEEHLLKMSITLLGDPSVVAKRTCVLKNFIEPFSDMKCYIQEIEYALVPGAAFTMTLKLMSKTINFNTPSEAMYELRRLERVKRDLVSKYREAVANLAPKAKLDGIVPTSDTSGGTTIRQTGSNFYVPVKAADSSPTTTNSTEPDAKAIRAEWARLVAVQ